MRAGLEGLKYYSREGSTAQPLERLFVTSGLTADAMKYKNRALAWLNGENAHQ